ncbi:uncharacterized protein LOC123302391 isoform X2 [Chrysoperla carnea]|uniref:uncharacterized protein LOC123302391 isoform X2 n=1 Tax=Chrysoperla carnea TaxID=189513 RepID=UPI001D05CE6E|nr:uncharacterized protein LOC123302391 isoform X2 [Chrysoperla carnea]
MPGNNFSTLPTGQRRTAPIKLVPLSEYTTEHAPLLDKKRLKAAKNRSVDKSDTSSKWRALVHKHMNKHKYAFWLFTPRFRLIVMKNGPAKSTPTCKKDFEVSETLTEGKSAILGKTGFGFNLKQWLHFLKLCLIVLRAPSIQYFWRSMDETNDGPVWRSSGCFCSKLISAFRKRPPTRISPSCKKRLSGRKFAVERLLFSNDRISSAKW